MSICREKRVWAAMLYLHTGGLKMGQWRGNQKGERTSADLSYAGWQEHAVTVCLLLCISVYICMQHEGSWSETTCMTAVRAIGCMLPHLFGTF